MLDPAKVLRLSVLSSRRSVFSWHYIAIAVVIVFSFELCFLSTGSAQGGASDEDVVRVHTDLAVFPVRVTDRNRRSVAGLTERDFALKDEDRVTTGPYFSAGTGRVALVFALDQSGSVREIISQQRDVAVALFSHFQSDSRLAILSFAQSASLIVPFKRDVSEARAAFDQLKSSNQRTAIFEAAAASSRAFEDLPKDPTERRIVILISDGLDNISRIKPSSAIEEARARGVSFYVIHLPLFEPREGRLAIRPPAKGFRELAEKTGGRYFLVGGEKAALQQSKRIDLTPVFQAIEDDLRSQYLVGFYVGARARDGRAHRVSISLVPAGFVYSVAQKAYSRTHNFSVNLAAGSTLESP